MDIDSNSVLATVSLVRDFSLTVAADRKVQYDTVMYKGLEVAAVEARIMEAQFRFLDGSTLLLLNDDEQFQEKLTLLLIDSGLRERDRVILGGAFTPGFLTYAYPVGPDEIAFCWHELDQVVTVRPYRPLLSLRRRWLRVRDLEVQSPTARPARGRPRLRLPQMPRNLKL